MELQKGVGGVHALSKRLREPLMGVQEDLKVVFSLRPLHPSSSASKYPCFPLLVVVAGIVFLSGHLR